VSLFLTHGDDPWVNFVHARESAEMLNSACIDGLLRRGDGAGPGGKTP